MRVLGKKIKFDKKILLIIILVVLVLVSIRPAMLFHKYYLTPCVDGEFEKQEDFAMYLEEVDLVAYGERLMAFNESFAISVREEIAFEGEEYPIYEIGYSGVGESEGVSGEEDKRLLIFSATHGDEFGSALVVPELLKDIVGYSEEYEGWKILIVGPINPVGLVKQSRYNEIGCDINRDFKEFKTVGARVQRDATEEFLPDVIVSLHEGPQKGFFVIGTKSVERELERKIAERLKEKGVVLAEKSFLGLGLGREGIMHEGMVIGAVKKVFGIYTLGRYGEEQGIGVLTTESSWSEENVSVRVMPHIELIKVVVEEFE